MTITPTGSAWLHAPLARFRAATAGADDLALLLGSHRAVFAGPAPQRVAAPLAIALAGLPRWHGKRFLKGEREGELAGHNLVRGDGGTLREVVPMTARVEASWLDGKPALVVAYGPGTKRPLRWLRDEFRPLDDGVLLALTFIASPRLRALAATTAFLLVRED